MSDILLVTRTMELSLPVPCADVTVNVDVKIILTEPELVPGFHCLQLLSV